MNNKKARSFITIMIVIALLSLVLRFSIEQIIRINIKQNELFAQTNLKLIATALDNYAKDHLGTYPLDFATLIKTKNHAKK